MIDNACKMSLFPYLMKFFDNSWDDEFNYNRYPERITRSKFRRQHSFNSYIRPSMFKADWDLKPYLNKCRHAISNLTSNYYDKDDFQVRLNVKNFAPSEVKVQIVGNTIVVEGKHEDKQEEHCEFYNQFVRKYSLPSGVNANDVISSLSSDGILTIKAKSTAKLIDSKERVIPIRQTYENIKSTQKDKLYESKERVIPIRRACADDTIRSRTKANEMEFFERIIPIERSQQTNHHETMKSTNQEKRFESRERVVPIRQIGESNKAQSTEKVTDYKREVVIPIQQQQQTATNDSYKTSTKCNNATESKERVVTITQISDAIRENGARAKAAETIRRIIPVHENIGTIVEEPPTPRLQSQEREIPVINQITEINESGPPKPPRTFASHERVITIQQTGETHSTKRNN